MSDNRGTPESRDHGQTSFAVKGLTKVYQSGDTQIHALRGVNIAIPSGEIIVLLGPSGSGKSTFLNIIGGLDQPSSGHVFFRSRDLASLSEQELTFYRRENIGFVFQAYNLVPSLTALENVALVTEIAENPISPLEALEAVALTDRANHFPAQLSGGEQQRVAIARAIAKRPEVLLCDEPTGALDSETGIMVLKALLEVNSKFGTTCIIITHNAAIAELAHQVVHFCDGKVSHVQVNEVRKSAEEMIW
ncbi:ABC transporter ATP-binding protein [Thalassomonas viridans]|uniref:ABC transporter ATP-binding protein n=1 Tax=Thalassomonas viridans TaxID=137584 RepID=A0AAF0C895_9GAMM|nr:ABC transporter ATP-binding protein [Thalassomonas viridans]WDE06177.1 ABC transporter ATP-binding protein [Thalassomonas viridans]